MKYARRWHDSFYRARHCSIVTSTGGWTMSHAVTVRNFQVIVDAPVESVFDFVNDLGNLPRWAIHFCKAIRLVPGGAIVTAASGEVYFGVTGDRDLGVLDWWSGPTMDSAQRWPTRVVGLPDGRSLYAVTAVFGDAAPPNIDQIFAEELSELKRLVEKEQSALV
jgi:hypothetical protein